MKVYVYKQYCDEYAYGEEIIEVYADKSTAEEQLRKDVENAFNMSWDSIPQAIGIDDDDTFTKDYVSISYGDSCQFWIIEEKEVVERS